MGGREQLEKGGAVGFPIWALRIVDASTKTWVSPSPTSKFRSDSPQETLHKSRNSSRAAFVAFGLFPRFPSNVYFLSKYDEPHFRTKTCFSREKGWLKLQGRRPRGLTLPLTSVPETNSIFGQAPLPQTDSETTTRLVTGLLHS